MTILKVIFAAILIGIVLRALGDAIGKAAEGVERAKAEKERARLYMEIRRANRRQPTGTSLLTGASSTPRGPKVAERRVP